MVYFSEIQPTRHYLDEHEKDGYYILFEINNNILYVINAKNTNR